MICLCYLWLTWGCSGTGVVTETTWLAKLKYLLTGPSQKKFADSYTDLLTIISGGWLHGDILLPISYISTLNVLVSNRYQRNNKNVKLFKCLVGVFNHSRDELNPLILE